MRFDHPTFFGRGVRTSEKIQYAVAAADNERLEAILTQGGDTREATKAFFDGVDPIFDHQITMTRVSEAASDILGTPLNFNLFDRLAARDRLPDLIEEHYDGTHKAGAFLDALCEKTGVARYHAPDLKHQENEKHLCDTAKLNITEAALLLLKHGADANSCGGHYGEYALHFAAAHNNVPLIGALIEHGANVNSADAYIKTPLHYAAEFGSDEAVTTLLKHPDIMPLAKDQDGKTAADIAKTDELKQAIEQRGGQFASNIRHQAGSGIGRI